MSASANPKLKVLIVDDESDIREMLSFSVKGAIACDIFTAQNGEEAIKSLKADEIDLIICDYNMPIKNGGDVYKYLLESESNCQYVLCSSEGPEQLPEFSNRSHLIGYLEKPNLIKGLREIIGKFKTTIPGAGEASPSLYIPVPISLLLKLSNIPSDIYIKLTEGRYVKVLNQNQVFDSNDFDKYTKKDVETLYCTSMAVDQVLEKIQAQIIELAKSTSLPVLDMNMKIHGILISTFRVYGLQESFIPFVEAQVKETLKICSKDKIISGLLDKIIKSKDTYIGTHSFMLAAVSVILATKLNWASDGPNTKLVICSLMHDIFLDENATNETKLLCQQMVDDAFKAHPQKAAELVNKITSMPPDTGRIILEQHEIGEEFGIPYGTHINKVSALGSLFSFCHYLVDSILEQHSAGSVNQASLFNKMEEISEKSIQYKKYLNFLKEVQLFN